MRIDLRFIRKRSRFLLAVLRGLGVLSVIPMVVRVGIRSVMCLIRIELAHLVLVLALSLVVVHVVCGRHSRLIPVQTFNHV